MEEEKKSQSSQKCSFNQISLPDIKTDKCADVGMCVDSPLGKGYVAKFEEIKFSENEWVLNDVQEEYKILN